MQVLYEDNHIIIVNKSPGEIVQGDKTGDRPLSEELKEWLKVKYNKPGNVFVGVVHRLDRPVSGVVVFAKTSKALTRLNEMLRKGEIHKTYWAVVKKMPLPKEGLLQHWLVRNEKLNKSFVVAEGEKLPEEQKTAKGNPQGNSRNNATDSSRSSSGKQHVSQKDAKLAKLKYKVLREGDNYMLLEVELLTGRHHQIRCQLSAIGCPIKGDLKYGSKRSNPDGSISLHARRVSFIHPVSKQEITVEALTPPDGVWKELTIDN